MALLGCFAGYHASAAQRTGNSPVARSIEGNVLDQNGHPLSGAIVLIEDLKSLQVRSYIVQQDGKFHFRALSADANYQVRARFNGVSSGPKTVSVFKTEPTVIVNFKLPIRQKHPGRSSGNPS